MSNISRMLRSLPIYVVTGKTEKWSTNAAGYFPVQDTGTRNDSYSAGGALPVTKITDITGLTAWKDYIPVMEATGATAAFSLDGVGYIPVKLSSGSIFSAVRTLVHFDGTSDATTFTDEYSGVCTIGTTAKLKTAAGGGAVKYGTAALLTNGYGAKVVTDAVDFGRGDFTLEAEIYLTSHVAIGGANPWMLHCKSAGGTDLGLMIYNAGGTISVYVSSTGNTWIGGAPVITSGANAIIPNGYYHIACTREGPNLKLFSNGAQVGSTYNIGTTAIYPCAELIIGNAYGVRTTTYGIQGYVDEVRAIKGTAAYTANFTRPTSAHTS